MKIRTLSMIAAALLLASSAAWAGSYVSHKSMHQDLACVDCHQEEVGRTPPPSEACLNCHGPMQDLIKKMEGFKRNPHYTPHWGDTVPCYTCHKEHKKSELLCANSYCHVKNFEGVTLK